jgi:hypothetical protein
MMQRLQFSKPGMLLFPRLNCSRKLCLVLLLVGFRAFQHHFTAMDDAEKLPQTSGNLSGSRLATGGTDAENSFAEEDTPVGETANPGVVDFDGPDDPENPTNWPLSKKTISIIMVTFMTLLSYVLPSETLLAQPDT